MSYIVGWDIGGSHIKYAVIRRSDGVITDIRQYPMPLWRGVARLRQSVERVSRRLPADSRHAVTMTAELADVFTTRQQGVREVVSTMRRVMPQAYMRFYGLNGFVGRTGAIRNWEQVASANWHAGLCYVASCLPTGGLFVDIGGTTADILPFAGHRPLMHGVTDHERLENGELLYSGVLRTPLAVLCDSAPYAGRWVRVCAERFADTADIYRLLGCLHPDQDQCDTADGNARDRVSCMRRLARVIGIDWRPAMDAGWMRLAAYFAGCQLEQLRRALAQVLSCHPGEAPCLVSAGCGAFLARRLALRHTGAHLAFSSLPGVRVSGRLKNGTRRVNDGASAVAVALLMNGGLS